MFLISASLTVYSLQTYRMKKEGHSYAYRDFCSHQEGVWGNGFSDVSWLNFPSWKLPIKAHKIYESAQSNRSLYILSILCIPCQLAHALTQGSECLVLDEPTNHLDIKYQLQIMDIVKSLGHTVVAAVHDLNIAAMYCDRLIAIQGGRWSAWGRRRSSWHRILSKNSMMWTVRSIMGRMKGWISSISRSIGRNDIVLLYSKEPC